jgi:succinate-semialdehyde dehydrogenase / glutarate-semialdehyde dehydrogenase
LTQVITQNPATGEQLAGYEPVSEQELEQKLQLAVSAQQAWKRTSLPERVSALRKLGSLLRAELEQHATLISKEMGKPISEALAEVEKCALTCDYYADNLEAHLAPRQVKTEAQQSYVQYDPLGVVLAIMPWNFPYWQVIRFAAPTLGSGNGGLLKHAANVTGCALAIEDVIARAGFTPGLFQTLVLASHDKVSELIADERIAAVTLTGSERAGAVVAAAAGKALKKTLLELGGSDPFVILDDANLENITPLAVKARFVNAGQSCLCAKRFIVDQSLVSEFETRLKEQVGSLVIGDPLDPKTQIGPLAKKQFVDEIDSQVQRSLAMGARLVAGGKRIEGPGNFYAPTVLADVTPDMPVFNEETFGPVLALVASNTDAQALELANASQYGLAASVWTNDLARGLALGNSIEAGALFINKVVASDPRLPFGGVKLSGYGRELAEEGLREFTNVKSVVIGG